MPEINLIADPLSLLAPLLAPPPTIKHGSFSGVLEEMRGQTTLSPNFSKAPEPEVELLKPAETMCRTVPAPNAEKNEGMRGQTTLSPNFSKVPELEVELLKPVETMSRTVPAPNAERNEGMRGLPPLSPHSFERPEHVIEVVKPAETRIQMPVPPSPQRNEGMSSLTPVSPNFSEVPEPEVEVLKPVETMCRTALAPNAERNEGMSSLTPLSGPVSPHLKRTMTVDTDIVVEDPTVLINFVRQMTTAPVSIVPDPEVQANPTHLVSIPMESETQPPQRLSLAEFGVTRFVYRTDVDLHPAPVREIKPVKSAT